VIVSGAEIAPIGTLLVPGRGVARLQHLETWLPEAARIVRSAAPPGGTDAVAGWGFKPTAQRARALAARRGFRYIAIEDGFLRSIGLGEAGVPPLGIVVDDLGIYYDARMPSRLEQLLERGGWQSDELLARADAARLRIVQTGLSKTNAAPPLDPALLPRDGRRRILVVDQTAGDAAIEGGMAGPESFREMLARARADEPEAEIVVRRHPAVAAGLKRGCLPVGLTGVTLLDADARAADILDRVDAVYTVTSLMGFEALIRGLPVRTFGMPFYAGWGATTDLIRLSRRTARRSVTEIFAAAYLLYSRYVNPITGAAATLEETIERLVLWRDVADENAGAIAAAGFRPWKRAAVRRLMASPRGALSFEGSIEGAVEAARAEQGRVMVWSGKESPADSECLAGAGLPILRMEDGFLRSRGLGSDFHLPASVVLDDQGIYYDRHHASRLETILETRRFDKDLLARAAELRRRMVEAGLSKYNVGGPARFPDTGGRPQLLVVGQVEDDRSIERGTGAIATNLALLKAARADHPNAFLVYKPHPDVETGNRRGAIPAGGLRSIADHVARDVDIAQCLATADHLATMTSLAGFEALMRGIPVTAYGGPFYAGWGLTDDRLEFPRRTRRLTLDMLVAGTLILYPRYVHPPTGLPCTAEDVVDWLEQARPTSGGKRSRWLRALVQSVQPGETLRY
jgi:capsular polysaccharide export protein